MMTPNELTIVIDLTGANSKVQTQVALYVQAIRRKYEVDHKLLININER